MEARLQKRIQRYGWDAAANVYEETWQTLLAAIHDEMLNLADLHPYEDVLEVACGSGFLTFRAADAMGSKGRIVASDISAQMIDIVQRRAVAKGYCNVAVQRVDAEELDAKTQSFDAVLCSLGLMYMPNPVVSLKHMHRALKPGGRGVFSVWGERRTCGWAEIFPIVDSAVKSDVCPLFFSLGVGDNLIESLKQAGFRDIRIRRIPVMLGFDDPSELLRAMIDGGAVALAAKRFSASTRSNVEQAFLQSVAAFRRSDDGYDIPSEAVIAIGSA